MSEGGETTGPMGRPVVSGEVHNGIDPQGITSPQTTAQRTRPAVERSDVFPIYRSLANECRRILLASGVAMESIGELAGLADRHVNKFLNPDSFSGRQANWGTLQCLLDVIAPDGFDVRLVRRRGPRLDAVRAKFELHFDKAFADAKTRRELLREWGRQGGLKHNREALSKIGRRGAVARNRGMPKEKRVELARRASRARWSMATKSQTTPRKSGPLQ